MATMARSVSAAAAVAAPLLLLLVSVLVSGASGARTVSDTVQDACSKTQFPKICVDSLAAKPESQKACPKKLAELFVNIAAEKGAGMATFVHGKYNAGGAKDDALFKCYDSCSDDVEEAVAHLNGLVREPTDGKFLELKSWLGSTLGGTSTCEDACKDAPKSADKDAVVNFSLDFEKLQRVTLDLITEASGSMSAGIALPPSDAGAPSYGPAAPYGGASSADAPAGSDAGAGGAEGPAAASGPSSGGDAPAYGGSAAGASGPAAADAPAAAGAGASGPSASAPAPASSESSGGAPGPSSDGGYSSGAPAPSSGDDDGDDADSDQP